MSYLPNNSSWKRYTNAHLQHAFKKRIHRAAKRRKKYPTAHKNRGQSVVYQLFKTINHFFPDFFSNFEKLKTADNARITNFAKFWWQPLPCLSSSKVRAMRLTICARKPNSQSTIGGCSSAACHIWTQCITYSAVCQMKPKTVLQFLWPQSGSLILLLRRSA